MSERLRFSWSISGADDSGYASVTLEVADTTKVDCNGSFLEDLSLGACESSNGSKILQPYPNHGFIDTSLPSGSSVGWSLLMHLGYEDQEVRSDKPFNLDETAEKELGPQIVSLVDSSHEKCIHFPLIG